MPGILIEESYPSTKVKSAYFTTPADGKFRKVFKTYMNLANIKNTLIVWTNIWSPVP